VASGITIQQAAKILDMSVHTLRYYEREGLLDPISRTEGGIRMYQPDNLDFLKFLSRLRLTGMPIRQVRRYALLVREGRSTMDARYQLLSEHRECVLAQIKALEKNLEVIDIKLDLHRQGWMHGDAPTDCSQKLQTLLSNETTSN
jgi:DNA-binding transcriptional MerR regulator